MNMIILLKFVSIFNVIMENVMILLLRICFTGNLGRSGHILSFVALQKFSDFFFKFLTKIMECFANSSIDIQGNNEDASSRQVNKIENEQILINNFKEIAAKNDQEALDYAIKNQIWNISDESAEDLVLDHAKQNKFNIFKMLIECGINLKSHKFYFKKCLRKFIKNLNFEAVRYCHKLYNVNNEYFNPLIYAIEHNRREITKFLLTIPGIDVNAHYYTITALMFASQNGQHEIVKDLCNFSEIDFNAIDCNKWTALVYAAKNGRLNIVRHLLSIPAIENAKEYCNKALVYAADNGYLEIVKLLAAIPGIDINYSEMTPLMCAARSGNLDIVQFLMSFPNIMINKIGCFGNTALCFAALFGQLEVVKYLLKHPSIDLKSNKQHENAIHCAFCFNYQQVIGELNRHNPCDDSD